MIIIGSDHTGIELKNNIINYLKAKNIDVIDQTNYEDQSGDDYPDRAYEICKKVLDTKDALGIAICGTGIGMSIALNKMKGIYCAKVSDPDEAIHTRYDNNTNVIALGEKMDLNQAILAIEQFIHTEYSFLEKHDRRNKKVRQIENGEYNG